MVMKLVFVCPTHKKVFRSADFTILDNKGIITGPAGEKTLDAKVVLNSPCPFCSEKHTYRATELSCPFDRSEDLEIRRGRTPMGQSKKIRLTATVAGSG